VICAGIVPFEEKIEKNKSEYEKNLSRTFDRAVSVAQTQISSILPTVIFLVLPKTEFSKKASIVRFLSRIRFLQ